MYWLKHCMSSSLLTTVSVDLSFVPYLSNIMKGRLLQIFMLVANQTNYVDFHSNISSVCRKFSQAKRCLFWVLQAWRKLCWWPSGIAISVSLICKPNITCLCTRIWSLELYTLFINISDDLQPAIVYRAIYRSVSVALLILFGSSAPGQLSNIYLPWSIQPVKWYYKVVDSPFISWQCFWYYRLTPNPFVLIGHFFAVALYSMWLIVKQSGYRVHIGIYKAVRTFYKACEVIFPLLWTELRTIA